MGRRSEKLNFSAVDTLIEELTKPKPDEERVAELMVNAGLNYQADPVARMTTLLDVLNGEKRSSGTAGPDNSQNGSDHEQSL